MHFPLPFTFIPMEAEQTHTSCTCLVHRNLSGDCSVSVDGKQSPSYFSGLHSGPWYGWTIICSWPSADGLSGCFQPCATKKEAAVANCTVTLYMWNFICRVNS